MKHTFLGFYGLGQRCHACCGHFMPENEDSECTGVRWPWRVQEDIDILRSLRARYSPGGKQTKIDESIAVLEALLT